MNKTLEAIVLSSRDYREADAILNVFCKEEGKQALVARGLRKMTSKNVGSTQLFTHAHFYVDFHDQKTMHAMRTADIIESYRGIREDLVKQAIASVICECMEQCVWDISEEGFMLLKHSLSYLEATTQPYALAALFLSIINEYQGIEPYVEGCVKCGRTASIMGISISQGGFLCSHCEKDNQTFVYSKDDLQCFRLVCKAKLEHFPILETYQNWTFAHFMMVYSFFEEYSGIKLRSMRFLKCLQDL